VNLFADLSITFSMVLNYDMTQKHDLEQIIQESFKKLKDDFYQTYKIEKREEDTWPPTLELRDIIESLPPNLQIIELMGPQDHQVLRNSKGYILKYNFDEPNSDKIEFYGSVHYTQPEKLVSILVDKFHFNEETMQKYAIEICKNFQIRGMWESNESWYLHFIPDDIVKNPQTLQDSLRLLFLSFPRDTPLSGKFRRPFHEYYSEHFDHKPDRIGFKLSLNKIQEIIGEIKLTPLVPEEVKRVFNRAKQLFIFGLFRYEFFAISQHYAYIVLESAIKARYMKSLGAKAILSIKSDHGFSKEITVTTYRAICGFCLREKLDLGRLSINGKPFPYSLKKLLDWLEENQLIRKWERSSYNAELMLRYHHLHQEHPTPYVPETYILKRIAEQINYLFNTSTKNEMEIVTRVLNKA
jgi:hypothetical protein